jgi:hypothetical protein
MTLSAFAMRGQKALEPTRDAMFQLEPVETLCPRVLQLIELTGEISPNLERLVPDETWQRWTIELQRKAMRTQLKEAQLENLKKREQKKAERARQYEEWKREQAEQKRKEEIDRQHEEEKQRAEKEERERLEAIRNSPINVVRRNLFQTVYDFYTATSLFTEHGYVYLRQEDLFFTLEDGVYVNVDVETSDLYDLLAFIVDRLRRDNFSINQYVLDPCGTGKFKTMALPGDFEGLFSVFGAQVNESATLISQIACATPLILDFPALDEDDHRLVDTLQNGLNALTLSLFRLCTVSAVRCLCMKTGEYLRLAGLPLFAYQFDLSPAENVEHAIQQIATNVTPNYQGTNYGIQCQCAIANFQDAFTYFQTTKVINDINEFVLGITPPETGYYARNVLVPIVHLISALGYLTGTFFDVHSTLPITIGSLFIDMQDGPAVDTDLLDLNLEELL